MTAKKKTDPKETVAGPPVEGIPAVKQATLFDRVVAILEQARASVVRAVNTHMVLANWMIGREIVEEIQGGEQRAEYGKAVLADLSRKLTARYGAGYSETTLQYFRKFYLVYQDRAGQIPRPSGAVFASLIAEQGISRPVGVESSPESPKECNSVIRHPLGDFSLTEANASPTRQEVAQDVVEESEKRDPPGSESLPSFSPQLNWSHYRTLMRVEKHEAREFYEREAIAGGWDKRTLERQIHSSYFERLLKSQQPQKMLAEGRRVLVSAEPAVETLKSPYVLEFLGLPDVAALRESDLESAILSYLQWFLLELGNGFALVARQKRIRIDDEDRYVDLVFYHCQQRFYLLIDLKMRRLTHGDVGQMDGYVRIFDDLCITEGDNPTIGLILCTEKSEVVARYSVLKDRKQIFASRYMLYLPTEEQLRLELERERRLIEAHHEYRLQSTNQTEDED